MDNKIAAFTFFTLFFFTVSAGRIPVDPPATNPWRESLPSAGSHILLPGEKPRPDSDESKSTANHPLLEPEKHTNDLTQRTNFSRFHPINRHFHGKPPRRPKQIGADRRPYRKSVTQNRIPRIEVAAGRKENEDSNRETFHGEVPTNWLKREHYYRSQRHRNQPRDNKGRVKKTKNVLDREKLKSLMREHKEKESEEETGFMKNIRKFLKHTLD